MMLEWTPKRGEWVGLDPYSLKRIPKWVIPKKKGYFAKMKVNDYFSKKTTKGWLG